MMLRTASLALSLVLLAFGPARAQEGEDIFAPSALQGGGGDAAKGGSRPNTQSNQAGSAKGSQTETDPLFTGGAPGPDTTPPQAGDEPELEWAQGERIPPPPPEVKAAIDAEAQSIAQDWQRYKKEGADLTRLSAEDKARADAETRRSIGMSERAFDDTFDAARRDGAATEVREVADAMGPDGRPVSRPGAPGNGTTSTTPRRSPWDDPAFTANRNHYMGSGANYHNNPYAPGGLYNNYSNNYGYNPIGYPNAGTPDSRMSWWQKLLLSSFEGVAEGVKGLMERRANEIKAREEKLRREYPEHKAYVEYETRRAIEKAAFARHGGATNDRRLDDLILGPAGNRGATTPAAAPPTTRRDEALAGVVRPSRPVARLPRERDPVTGEEKIVIDMPLGVDAVRPIR